LKWTLTN
jgi:hypothetical protein